MMTFRLILLALMLPLAASLQAGPATDAQVNMLADRYVKLVLAIGEHEPGYVDAYYGPQEWQQKIKRNTPDLSGLETEASAIRHSLGTLFPHEDDKLKRQRLTFLDKQLLAAHTRIKILQGATYSFDEETRLLFDAVVPPVTTVQLEQALAKLDTVIAGTGSLQDRFVSFRKQFQIPKDKLEDVFAAAITACKERTAEFLQLPKGEHFRTEFVTDKPWSGYNWYQGNATSLIQVNTDLPSLIDSAVNLGCHEGYPGHHVFNTLLESNLVNDKGWREFSVYPLYSPQSLLAEGTASYARTMAFPGPSQTDFEIKVLYPLAGLDTSKAKAYADALSALSGLRYARIEGARRYLDGKISREELVDWLARYQLVSRERAEQGVRFIETYRGYVINYTLGSDLSAQYIARKAGKTDQQKRWEAYKTLLSTPLTASMLEQ